jgi:hypothetical protein
MFVSAWRKNCGLQGRLWNKPQFVNLSLTYLYQKPGSESKEDPKHVEDVVEEVHDIPQVGDILHEAV